jgi:thymidylate kinase
MTATQMTPSVIAISGPSGAGKTTVSRLVADAFEPSVHIRMDAFMPSVVRGWIDPWLPEAEHQNRVLGGAVAAAAIQFAVGGYTVVLDGNLFPDGVKGLAQMAAARRVSIHYVVLRPDLATCLDRIDRRPRVATGGRPEYEDFDDRNVFAALHDRYADLEEFGAHAVGGTGPAEEIAATVLPALSAGRFAVAAY